MCTLFLIPTPRKAHYQHSSIHICIASEKQNSKSFQATSALLGSYKNWQLGEMKIPLSFLSSFHRKWHERFAQIALLRWPHSQQGKTTLTMRRFILVTGSRLTTPQNSQPQTTESLTRELCSVSDFGTANSTRRAVLKNTDHSHAHIVKWAGANLAQSCTPSE